jgi:hypothetical protein
LLPFFAVGKYKHLNIRCVFVLLEVFMGKIIAKNIVKRQHGYLYYVDAQGNVCEAKMSRGGRAKKKRR